MKEELTTPPEEDNRPNLDNIMSGVRMEQASIGARLKNVGRHILKAYEEADAGFGFMSAPYPIDKHAHKANDRFPGE